MGARVPVVRDRTAAHRVRSAVSWRRARKAWLVAGLEPATLREARYACITIGGVAARGLGDEITLAAACPAVAISLASPNSTGTPGEKHEHRVAWAGAKTPSCGCRSRAQRTTRGDE